MIPCVVITPSGLVNNIYIQIKRFVRGEQQCVLEFLDSLLDLLQRDLREKSILDRNDIQIISDDAIDRLFGGQMVNNVKCSNRGCNYSSSKQELFINLTLELDGVDNVNAPFMKHCAKEQLDQEEHLNCHLCRKQGRAIKSSSILFGPPFLKKNSYNLYLNI
jgi:ubiquitin C-terminal hydrolase